MVTIDNDLRTINIPSDLQFLGVAGDKDVNQIEFEMPIRYKEIDLSSYNVKIKYRNIERGKLRYIEGEYTPIDKIVTTNLINFSWIIGENVCKYQGITEFSICLSDRRTKEFNTRWVALPVLKKQLSPIRYINDSENLKLDIEGLTFTVENENLIVSKKGR